jgi:hypothetical protein
MPDFIQKNHIMAVKAISKYFNNDNWIDSRKLMHVQAKFAFTALLVVENYSNDYIAKLLNQVSTAITYYKHQHDYMIGCGYLSYKRLFEDIKYIYHQGMHKKDLDRSA